MGINVEILNCGYFKRQPYQRMAFITTFLFQESDCESSVGSPEPASLDMGADTGTDLTVGSKQMHNRLEEANSSETKMSPNSSAASHLNGTSQFKGTFSMSNVDI